MTQTEIPENVLATPEKVREALENGGRAEVTIRSRKTGAHVHLLLSCKKRKPEGRGYLSRATVAGMVGYSEADKIDVTDPDLEFPENKVGAFMKGSQRFYTDGADPARTWAAEHVICWALGGYPELDDQAEVLLATRCSRCGIKLTDPVSVSRGQGPECWGKATGSKMAPRRLEAVA